MIEVKDLVKDYVDEGGTTRAVAGVSFRIDKGEFVSIMGPSGSGKSTLLHILSFMDRPTDGTYKFQGHEINSLSDHDLAHIRNQEMGFVFQSFNLLAHASVYENVEMPLLYNHDVPARARKAKVEHAIESVGLKDKINIEGGKLSGGQKQRVAIARALVNDPNILFADEPTGNLDSASGAAVMEILEKLNHSGRTVMLVTHETYTAEFARRLIRIKDGLVESDAPIAKSRRSGQEFFK